MPTDSYSCKNLRAYFVSASLLLFCIYNSLAANPNSSLPNDSTLTNTRPDTATAAQLTEMFKPNLRTDMIDFAKQFLGLSYRYAGRTAKTGFDCSGFTHYIMKNFDINISTCSRAQVAEGVKVLLKDVKSGDLIFFRRSKRSRISHVAMVASNDARGLFIIHSTYRGVVIDNLLQSKYWRPKVYTARDIANPFTEKYSVERVEQLLAQQAKLKSLQIDLDRLSKTLSI